MTKQDIQEKRLRRLDKRIRHLTALLRVTAIFGGPAKRQAEKRVRDLMLTEAGRLWEMLHPDGEPEDQARKTTICASMAWTGGSRSGQSIARKGQGTDVPSCGHPVDK